MTSRLKRIFETLDKFVRNYQQGHQIKYIRLKPDDYKLVVKYLPHYQRLIADKKGYFEYRDFTVIPEK